MSLAELGAVISPAFIVGGFIVAIARWLWKRFEAHQEITRVQLEAFNAGLNKQLLDRLDASDDVQKQTLAQAQKTNGRVDTLESRQMAFEKEHSVFRERLSHVEGQAEVLLREKGQPI